MALERNSVVLAYITGGSNENCFTESLVGTLGYDAGHGNLICDVRCVEGVYLADNRDLAARRFMRYRLCAQCRSVLWNGNTNDHDGLKRCETCKLDNPSTTAPEWFWFVDTDISFQSYDVLYQLLSYADPVERPIVSALYFGYMGVDNGTRIVPIWFGLSPDNRIEHIRSFSSGLNKLGVAGMGCCLIHRSVFEKFGTRYAHTGWLYFGHDVAPWVPLPAVDNDMTPFGEDNCFCFRCTELGIPIYGVGSIVVEHRKKRYESLRTFLRSFDHTEEKTSAEGTSIRLRRVPPEKTVGETIHGMEQPGNGGHQSASLANGSVGPEQAPVLLRAG